MKLRADHVDLPAPDPDFPPRTAGASLKRPLTAGLLARVETFPRELRGPH